MDALKVIVEILTGKVFNIQVDKDATVAELKREIEAQEDLPNNRLILMFEGSLLNGNEAPLFEYGVGEGSHVYLFFHVIDNESTENFLLYSQECILYQPLQPRDS
ncbi:hypothetical protein RJ640_011280 [Escallonia rubra]|uniref:Ubiquitin-like domain-containing protein n=1 Tax=Escallonia rubra TaxID=112253 RepID=A0AA88RKL0_9ASTE|nr:hypothetical protein RJ640_011280 [Escallonia rubra]